MQPRFPPGLAVPGAARTPAWHRAAAPATLLLGAALLAACQAPPPPGWTGYAEGDYVRVAAPLAGALVALPVQAGQTLAAAGQPLFTLDAQAEAAAQQEAAARAAASLASARNADSGRRADEIAVTRAQLAQAQAAAALARSALARQRQLVAQGFISPASLDDAQAAATQTAARVAELEAALKVAALPARPDERAAARATAQAAEQALAQSRWRLEQKTQHAPAGAGAGTQVADTYYRVGEWVPAGAPVVALLPPGAVKARFWVAEPELGTLQPGQAVQLQCDGCGAPIAAHITRIATQPEYTPPVIYSQAQRARLVFMVEARPDAPADAQRLKPGQPLDVRRAP